MKAPAQSPCVEITGGEKIVSYSVNSVGEYEMIRDYVWQPVDICNLHDVDLHNIDPGAPLTGPESYLGIDSPDALEIAVTVQKKYCVSMNSENTSRMVVQSLASLAEYDRHSI